MLPEAAAHATLAFIKEESVYGIEALAPHVKEM